MQLTRSLRLEPALNAELVAVAEIKGVSVNQFIAHAIVAAIDAEQQDKDFRARLQEAIELNQALLNKLRGRD